MLHTFTVKWEVEYYEVDEVYEVEDTYQAENLKSLLKDLEENIEDYTPEMKTPPHSGDFNIEFLSIKDSKDKEIWNSAD